MMTTTRLMAAALGLASAVALAPIASGQAIAPGARYVAMGSSFAAGSGVTTPVRGSPARCQRSVDNYAQQLARLRKLKLVDVTCGGATTAHVLGPWNELPPQIDALTADTALVTITIGGNDLGYIAGLITGSCSAQAAGAAAAQPLCRAMAARRPAGAVAAPAQADAAAWRSLETAMTTIVREIRRRSPRARVIFVDYQTVLPAGAPCAQTPVSEAAAADARAMAARLALLTRRVARRNQAEALEASRLSARHDACAAAPWMTGFIPPADAAGFVPYHPNLAGMTAIASALDRRLGR